ncbi:glycosyltransferase [Flavobacterium sp.]|uniref:glycosyltransferase n=1 Tax=Flavobacterium sp. TaxID=239 RepID=UPI002626B632|nr:glycosyltransferase [Flavobacterium sp.]
MRIVQIIDSLDAGGAEMMAVNYANTLCENVDFSGLIATRREGSLKSQINENVSYLFLNRKHTLDFKAVIRVRKFCKMNQIQFLHAHSSSYAIACMVKILHPAIRIVWHDHDGMSEFLQYRKKRILQLASYFFFGIIAVNNLLREWDAVTLHCRNVIYLPNFSNPIKRTGKHTVLKGKEGKRILCLANLRPQKDHFMLVDVASKFISKFPDWSFHLVGKDFEDHYSVSLKKQIAERNLSHLIFIYGSREDIGNIIAQSDICILTSSSEGLPVSLLEYGFYKKPVVATAVGQVASLIKHGVSGYIAENGDVEQFEESLSKLAADTNLQRILGESLHDLIIKDYSDQGIIDKYRNWLKSCNG